jgi:two-component system, OmpR family, response regulator
MKRPEGQWPTALAGALEHVGLSSLLSLLEMDRRSGLLDLRTRRREARLALRDGRVVAAVMDDLPTPGCDVVCEVLTWKHGRFVFRVGPVEATDEATLPMSVLLLEAARRADEIAAA